jgi:peptidoglycan/xylan/chitin deacetylase (PgdA/CDA1 family)
MLLRALLPLLLLATPTPAPSLPATFVPPPILMYHRVDVDRPADRVGRELTVTPAQLAAQLGYLKSRGIAAISMAQLQQRLESGKPLDHLVVLTFDDGYADQYAYAVPLLRTYGSRATFYIVTGEVGRPRHLTWEQLRAMESEHMDLAAHGVFHDDLSRMTPAQQVFQIDDSVSALQAGLHERVDSYAYPSGRFNRTTLQIIGAAGVTLAVTTDPINVLPPENRFEMTRVRVRGEWSIADFAAAVQSAMLRLRVVFR